MHTLTSSVISVLFVTTKNCDALTNNPKDRIWRINFLYIKSLNRSLWVLKKVWISNNFLIVPMICFVIRCLFHLVIVRFPFNTFYILSPLIVLYRYLRRFEFQIIFLLFLWFALLFAVCFILLVLCSPLILLPILLVMLWKIMVSSYSSLNSCLKAPFISRSTL